MQAIGGYAILDEIGRGSVCTVYKVVRDDRLAALKVLSSEWARDENVTDRFVREGMILGRLNHPGIVRVLDVGRDKGRFYLALEYVEGPTFARAMARRAFTLQETTAILAAVGHALHYAHLNGIIHSDIVPGNILLKGDGRPKLGDFGISRMLGERYKPGVTAGTPVYMSPEQAAALGDVIDGRSDIYSLGAVLYEAVTGRAPFRGASTLEILEQVVKAPLRPPSRVDPSLDPRLEQIILKAMDKDPGRRYATASHLAKALEGWSQQPPVWHSMVSP